MERNTLAWPSIEQLPRVVCNEINQLFAAADIAATQIQRAYRGTKPSGSSGRLPRGRSRHQLHLLLVGTAVSASEKLDGTNVGVMMDGTFLGRRQLIDAAATSYQRCDLTILRALKNKIADALDELAVFGSPVRAAMYGELCCNAALYSYASAGIAKTWQAFGALLEFSDERGAREYAHAAAHAGIVCNCDGAVVRVCNNATFERIARRHGIPVIAAAHHTSLCAAVEARREWMLGENGEGLVLSVATDPGKAASLKWKISREPQPTAIDLLTELAEVLSTKPAARLLDAEIHEMVASLKAVATHADSTLQGAPVPPVKLPKHGEEKGATPGYELAIPGALQSALTKFDSIESWLDAHGPAGTTRFTDMIVAEMLTDADLRLPEGDKERMVAVKEVTRAVKQYVGVQLGLWKRATAKHNS